MSKISFLLDPVFWSAFLLLNLFWVAGFVKAYQNGWALPWQMKDKHGICWCGHFGFWSLLLFVQPALAWATAKMWSSWQTRPGLILACLWVGGMVGYGLQRWWSKQVGSSDAWSYRGKPNNVGKIHIAHMCPEIGIMLMLLVSGLWFREMPWTMFVGILAIIVNHLIIGATHWPLRRWYPDWRPEGMLPLTIVQRDCFEASLIILLAVGFILIY